MVKPLIHAMNKEKIKALWKLCFDDSEEFTELYFNLRYDPRINVAMQSGEDVIAAMQLLPYPMTFGGTEIGTAYISGACTHPDYRRRGVMRQLLGEAFARMQHDGVALATLIPANAHLFDYYARSGFSPVFRCRRVPFHATIPDKTDETFRQLDPSDKREAAEAYACLDRKLHERPYCVQHTAKDFDVILADLKLGEGKIYTLGSPIDTLAITYPKGNGQWIVGETVAGSPETETVLLQHVCQALDVETIEQLLPPSENDCGEPLGMARVIDAQSMLQRYARLYPETEWSIQLTDEQLSNNNGFYYLSKGHCMKSAKRLPGSHLALSIGMLTEKIFAESKPWMSLMLN